MQKTPPSQKGRISITEKDVASLTNYADKKLLETNELSEILSTVPSIVQRGGIYLIGAAISFTAILLYFGRIPVWVNATGNIVPEVDNIPILAEENAVVTEVLTQVGEQLPKDATLFKIKTPIDSQTNSTGENQIKIPKAGKIVKLSVKNPGKVISKGTLLAVLTPAENRFQVQAKISQQDIFAIKPGMEAQIKIDAYHSHNFDSIPAQVNQIIPDIEQPGNFIVTLDLLENSKDKIKSKLPDITLLSGLKVQVQIQTKEQRLYQLIFNK